MSTWRLQGVPWIFAFSSDLYLLVTHVGTKKLQPFHGSWAGETLARYNRVLAQHSIELLVCTSIRRSLQTIFDPCSMKLLIRSAPAMCVQIDTPRQIHSSSHYIIYIILDSLEMYFLILSEGIVFTFCGCACWREDWCQRSFPDHAWR